MFRVLITDEVSKECLAVFEGDSRFHIEHRKSTDAATLLEIVPDYDAIIVRSGTRITADAIARAKKLRAIARAGVGVDNIDVEAATKAGVVVMNTPEGNTISAAEHTMAMMLACSRNIARADRGMRKGDWRKKEFTGSELRGKTLGVVGLGKIGREVAKRARSFEMEIIGFDPVITESMAREWRVALVSLDEIWSRADYITVHVPLNEKTKNLISTKELARMKPGARIVNCARGGIIDERALAEALKTKKIAAAALDVFEEEPPKKDNPLLTVDEATLTPHLGASTVEAQENVGIESAQLIRDYLSSGAVRNAVNAPALDPATLARIEPFRVLAAKIGSLHGQLLDGKLKRFSVTFAGAAFGDAGSRSRQMLLLSALEGFFRHYLSSPVNYVSVTHFAREHGIELEETSSSDTGGYINLISIKVETTKGDRKISGAIFGERNPRIVEIDGHGMDAIPDGHILVFANDDRPGMLGAMATSMGKNRINIATVSMGRDKTGGTALALMNVDSAVPDDIVRECQQVPGILWVKRVVL